MKERVRCVYHATLPFTKIPGRMLLVYFCVFRLNSFPAKDGISNTLSPRSIIHGTTHIEINKHAKLEFGEYVQSHEEHDNTMATRTTGAIALRPTGNGQGGYYTIYTACALGRCSTAIIGQNSLCPPSLLTVFMSWLDDPQQP